MDDPAETQVEPGSRPRRSGQHAGKARRKRATAANPRWTHVCAWDGHELGASEEYVEISAHERVCRFHYPQFQTWLRETAKTIYQESLEEEPEPVVTPRIFPGWRRARGRRVRRRRR